MTNPISEPSLPFSKDYEPEPEKRGLKISNTRSMFAKAPGPSKQEFEQRADEYMDERTDRNKRALDLAKQFISLLNDKTLPQNRGLMNNDVEQEVKKNLIQLAMDANNDENEPNEAMGSIALISLLLKTTLIQRDFINTLEYKALSLEKKVVQLEQKLSSLSVPKVINDKKD
jgi:hypothetical protein